jgi:cellulose synthase/poly-beta-1,6-N-acetylglucosamine synthase-like glycosyltransferase
MPSRRGKTAGLNEAVKAARGEILVLSDADSMYETAALTKIAGTFSGEPGVGLVTGSTKYLPAGDGTMAETGSAYSKLEHFIKRRETLLGSCVGADGAIFGVRRSLYRPLRDDDINDLVIPLTVVRQGFRAVLREDLYCHETSSPDTGKEFQRQIRITSRTLRAVFGNIDLMNPLRHPLFAFQLLSHKLMRFLAPVFMIAFFLCNTLLLGEGVIYTFTWTAQALAYLFVLIRYLKERMGGAVDILGFLYHFIMINISMLAGWIQFLSGKKVVTWNPRGR